MKRLKRELAILEGFHLQQRAYRVANDLCVGYPTVTRVYQRLRETICRVAELEGGEFSGEIEPDESYFGAGVEESTDEELREKRYFRSSEGAMGECIRMLLKELPDQSVWK